MPLFARDSRRLEATSRGVPSPLLPVRTAGAMRLRFARRLQPDALRKVLLPKGTQPFGRTRSPGGQLTPPYTPQHWVRAIVS